MVPRKDQERICSIEKFIVHKISNKFAEGEHVWKGWSMTNGHYITAENDKHIVSVLVNLQHFLCIK